MLNQALINEYENILLGKKQNFSSFFFEKGEYANEQNALLVFKYAFEYYLKWDPLTLRDVLDFETLKKLKLHLLLKYVRFPAELDPEVDLFYIAWKLYPSVINFSQRDLIVRVYDNLLNGKISKFPKDFFTGSMGIVRAGVCLQHLLSNYMQFGNLEHIYSTFGKKDIMNTLKKYKLNVVCKDVFDSPVDYLHLSLPKEQQNECYFSYYKFWYLYKNN